MLNAIGSGDPSPRNVGVGAMPRSVIAKRVLPDAGPAIGTRAAVARLVMMVVSSNRLTREGLADLLRRRTGFDVEACALDILSWERPPLKGAREIIVLDESADRDQVVQLAIRARRVAPHADVVVTGVVGRDSIGALIDAGVRAFVLQNASPDELIATIATLSADMPVSLVPGMIQSAGESSRPPQAQRSSEVVLTPREQQVVRLIADGMSNKEITATLGIAIHTVKTHVHNVLQKLSVGSRLALAALVRQQGGVREMMSAPVNRAAGNAIGPANAEMTGRPREANRPSHVQLITQRRA